MKKIISLLLVAVMMLGLLCACAGEPADNGVSSIVAPESDIAMQYMTVEEAHGLLNTEGYTFVDVRKADDHNTSCVPGSIGIDMDAAKNGDFDAGVAAMQTLAQTTTDTLIIVCYSGKSYAQATTNVLYALGYDMTKVYTLEGGYTAWTEAYADEAQVNEQIVAPESDVEMQYMTVEEAHGLLNTEGYVFLDVRKSADHNITCIPGSVSADMDAAKNGDFDAGVATMQVATRNKDNTLIIVCYSGKSYAQATTNVLSALGYDMTKVYTLEGGFNAWTKAYPSEVQLNTIVAPEADVEMQYMTPAEAAEVLGTEGYTFFDVRKAADYATSHIPGAVSADMDAAKEGDFAAGVATMQVATRGMDDTLILICYSGKRYAQATTNVLSALGYDMTKVYTLEGGFAAWTEAYPDNVTAE
ncbi:MAG: rhodanese-like domain-containing protein [Oscillospiraceae bacterium]|nr:rhodanese-like domain-containing protein [Oscillospiraceae bacterium]